VTDGEFELIYMNGVGILKLLTGANDTSCRATGILHLLSHSDAAASECEAQASISG
jgi:hypothetical protein